jgi:hypothetical protein
VNKAFIIAPGAGKIQELMYQLRVTKSQSRSKNRKSNTGYKNSKNLRLRIEWDFGLCS